MAAVNSVSSNLYSVNFRAKDNDARSYVVYSQPKADRQAQMIYQQQRNIENQKKKQNFSWGLGILLTALMIVVFLPQAMRNIRETIANKAAKDEAMKRAAEDLKNGIKKSENSSTKFEDPLYRVDLVWKDMQKAENKVAPLDSPTTNKALKEEFQKLIDNSKLSDKAKEWSGYDESTELLYLYGYGGTGKTYVAEQYAQEIGAIFTKIKYPDLGSSYVDAPSKKVNNMFKQVTEFANENKDRQIVVCLDEVDALIRKIDEASHGKENASKVRAAVLTGIDELKQNTKNVKIVMTSNYNPENGVIDDVIKRRLNKNIEVKLPDKDQMKALFEMYLKKIKAIKSGFYNSSEFKNFVDTMVREGYSSGEVEVISHEASSIFSSKLKGIPDDQLEKQKFMMEYLKKAKQLKGQAASKTNESMKAKKS